MDNFLNQIISDYLGIRTFFTSVIQMAYYTILWIIVVVVYASIGVSTSQIYSILIGTSESVLVIL